METCRDAHIMLKKIAWSYNGTGFLGYQVSYNWEWHCLWGTIHPLGPRIFVFANLILEGGIISISHLFKVDSWI